DAGNEAMAKAAQARAMRTQLADRKGRSSAVAAEIDALDKKLADLAGPAGGGGRARGGGGGAPPSTAPPAGDAPPAASGGRGGRGGRSAGGPPPPDSFGSIQGELSGPFGALQGADGVPTTQVVAAADDRLKLFATLKGKWDAIVKTDPPALNAKLKARGAEPVSVPTAP